MRKRIPLQEVDAEEGDGRLIRGGRLIRTIWYSYLSGRILHRDYKNYILSAHPPLSASAYVARPWADNT